jgi:hypothetical protein
LSRVIFSLTSVGVILAGSIGLFLSSLPDGVILFQFLHVNNITSVMQSSDIEEESNLVAYTNSHFMNQLNIDMEKFRDNEKSGTASGSTSASGSDNDEYTPNSRFRKLTYSDVLKSFNNYNVSCKYSSELDIIISYLNGQKNLYKYHFLVIRQQHNILFSMVIFISSIVTLSTPFIVKFEWSGPFISSINSLVVILMIIMKVLNIEATAQSFNIISERYKNLKMSLEVTNSRLMFLENNNEQTEIITMKLKEFEDKISDIKLMPLDMPQHIKTLFPVLYDVNIFAFIKRVETYKKNLMLRYKDVKNELRFIRHNGGENQLDRKTRLRFLTDTKEKIKDEIIQHRNIYEEINTVFVREIKCAERTRWFWPKTSGVSDYDSSSIVYKHL